MGTDSPEAIVAWENSWISKAINGIQKPQPTNNTAVTPNTYLTALNHLKSTSRYQAPYQLRPCQTLPPLPPSLPIHIDRPLTSGKRHRHQTQATSSTAASTTIPSTTTWVCKNATFAYMMIQHISAVSARSPFFLPAFCHEPSNHAI